MADTAASAESIIGRAAEQHGAAIIIAEDLGAEGRRVIHANQAFLDLLGYELDEVLGRESKSFLCPVENDFEKIAHSLKNVRAHGYTTYVMTAVRSDGTRIPLHILFSACDMPDGGRQITYLCRRANEEEVNQSQSVHRNRLLAEAERMAHLGSWRIVPESRTLICSPHFIELLGGDDETAIHDAARTVPQAIRSRIWRCAVKCKRTGEPFEVDVNFTGRDGKRRTGRLSGQPDTDHDGHCVAVIGVFADTTDSVEMAAKKQRLEQTHRETLELLGIGVIDFEEGVSRPSPEAMALIGYPPEAASKPYEWWLDRMHPDDAAMFAHHNGSANHKAGETQTFRFRIRHKDGHYLWLESRRRIRRLTADGRIASATGVVLDIGSRLQAEREHEETRTQLDIGVRAADIGLFTIDPVKGQAHFSAEASRILGFPPEALDRPLKWWTGRIHPDDRRHALSKNNKYAALGGDSFALEYRVKRYDGAYVWLEVRSAFEFDENGEPIRLSGALMSINQRKTAEEALERLQNVFTLAARAARIGVYEGDFSTDIAVYSPQAALMLGMEEKSFSMHRSEWIERIHPEDRPGYLDYVEKRKVSPEQMTIEYRIRRQNGDYLWLEARSASAVATEDGKVGSIVGVFLDIDERKRAELELQDLQERMNVARSAVQLGLWNYDTETREGVWSPECTSLLGLSADHAFDPYVFHDGLHDADRERVMDVVNRLRAGELGSFQERFRFKREDGGTLWLETQGRATKDGGTLKIYGSLSDVTNEAEHAAALETAKRAAEEAAETKARFLATMSHEIRTPLNAVIGMTGLLLESDLESEQRRQAETANSAGEHLLCLINDILDLTKLDSGRVELENRPFSLAAEIARVIDITSQTSSHKGLAVTCDIEEEARGHVRGDAPRLRQVLLNLVGNAVKFTEQGGVEIRARRLEGETMCLEVADTGIGISNSARQRLFDDFVQADAGINRRFGGTGLGLSICKRLVELMNGRIGVDSKTGEGSTFWIELPLAPAADSGESMEDAEIKVPPGARLLVAEDNTANQLLISTILKRYGCSVTLVNDGAEALEAAGETVFDLIILDVEMPRVDGVQAAHRIRAGETLNTEVPMMALTAHTGRNTPLRQTGFDDVLGKPFSPRNLAASLSRLLAQEDRFDMTDALDAPLVDRSTLEPIIQAAGAETMARVLDAFWTQSEPMMNAVEDACEAQDAEKLRHAAHDMKGAASNIGAARVASFAAAMEPGPVDEACEMLSALRNALVDTRPALDHFIKNAA